MISWHIYPDNIRMLYNRLEWYKWVLTNLYHDRQLYNRLIPPLHESPAVGLQTCTCISCLSGSVSYYIIPCQTSIVDIGGTSVTVEYVGRSICLSPAEFMPVVSNTVEKLYREWNTLTSQWDGSWCWMDSLTDHAGSQEQWGKVVCRWQQTDKMYQCSMDLVRRGRN